MPASVKNIVKDDKVTIAKGIGIILMVLGHCGIPFGREFIYMFHMPLFFIIAGYCFKESHLNNFTTYFHRRIKGLYIPFVKYGLIFLLLHNLFYYLNIYNGTYGYNGNVSHLYSIKETVFRAVETLLFTTNEEILGGYWFLPQLFYASIIGWIILKFFPSPIISIVILLCLSIVCNFFGIYIPHISVNFLSLFAAAFFILGYLIQKHKADLKLWGLIISIILVFLGCTYWRSGMPGCSPAKQLPYFISAVAGTLMVMKISGWIIALGNAISKFLIVVGNNTLQILTWHFLGFKLVSFLIIKTENLPIDMCAMFPTIDCASWPHWWMIYALAGLFLPFSIIVILKYTKIGLNHAYATVSSKG